MKPQSRLLTGRLFFKFYFLPHGIAATCDSLEDYKWGVAMAPRCFIKPLGSESSFLTLKASSAFRGAQLETAHRDRQVAINERTMGPWDILPHMPISS